MWSGYVDVFDRKVYHKIGFIARIFTSDSISNNGNVNTIQFIFCLLYSIVVTAAVILLCHSFSFTQILQAASFSSVLYQACQYAIIPVLLGRSIRWKAVERFVIFIKQKN